MAERYNPAELEPKWQKQWEADKLYRQVCDPDRPKWYALTMYPYPSGDLHIGHWYAMAPADVKARYMRMPCRLRTPPSVAASTHTHGRWPTSNACDDN